MYSENYFIILNLKMNIVLGQDPKIDKFINRIMLDGKKSLAIRLLDETFEEIKNKGHKNPKEIFDRALENVLPNIEVRPKRVGWSIYQVPQDVRPKRQMFLATRWILGAARSKKWISFPKALAIELLDASSDTWDAIKKKQEMYKMAEANKAFARFATRR